MVYKAGLDQDPIVADLLTSGWIEFVEGKSSHYTKPGQICPDEIADAVDRESWDVSWSIQVCAAPGSAVNEVAA